MHTELDSGRNEHPVDIVEQVAAINQWRFERPVEDEISIAVTGGWTEYHAGFTWIEPMQALHLGCAFDLKVPEQRIAEVLKLIAMVNEQLFVGHFDLWPKDGVVMFRHSLLLAGNGLASPAQCETLLNIAVDACEQYFQAFQFVVWAGHSARDALAFAMFETVGEA